MLCQRLVGEQIDLIVLTPSDIPSYVLHFSPTVQKLLHVTSAHAEAQYVQERLKQSNLSSFLYGIKEKNSQHIIGGLEIRDASVAGQLYIWLNEQYWGTGMYRQALQLAAYEYFAHTTHHYFTACVDVTNKRSYWALKKFGFADYGMRAGPYGKQYQLILRKR